MSVDLAARPYYRWLLVAAKLEVRRRAERTHIYLDAVALREHLTMAARAQFAVDMSYERLKEAQMEFALARADPLQENEAMFRAFAEAHTFLVFAALFWNSLRTLATHFALPELDDALEVSEASIGLVTKARNHIEHVSERIEEGRAEARGGAMSADDFRAAVGAIQGDEVIFGSERFGLGQMRAAIHRATEAVAGTMDRDLRVSFKRRT